MIKFDKEQYKVGDTMQIRAYPSVVSSPAVFYAFNAQGGYLLKWREGIGVGTSAEIQSPTQYGDKQASYCLDTTAPDLQGKVSVVLVLRAGAQFIPLPWGEIKTSIMEQLDYFWAGKNIPPSYSPFFVGDYGEVMFEAPPVEEPPVVEPEVKPEIVEEEPTEEPTPEPVEETEEVTPEIIEETPENEETPEELEETEPPQPETKPETEESKLYTPYIKRTSGGGFYWNICYYRCPFGHWRMLT